MGGVDSSDRSISGPVFGDGDCIWRFLYDAGNCAILDRSSDCVFAESDVNI